MTEEEFDRLRPVALPASPSPTARPSSPGSRAAGSPRPGGSSTSSRRCDSSARFLRSEPDHGPVQEGRHSSSWPNGKRRRRYAGHAPRRRNGPDAAAGVVSPLTVGGTTSGIQIQTEDADGLWARALEAGAEVRHQLANQFWGGSSRYDRRPSQRNGPLMSTAVRPRQRTAAIERNAGAAQPAGVFVVCGVTGSLAKVMTFHPPTASTTGSCIRGALVRVFGEGTGRREAPGTTGSENDTA
jgi:hypothetical protein